MPRESNQPSSVARALSPLAKLSAGVFCNQLSAFLREVATVGGVAAVGALTGPYIWTVVAAAGLFGFTEAWQSRREKKKAGELADQLDSLAKSDTNALELLHAIADGKIGVTLDWITQEELKDRIVAGLSSAGLATSAQLDGLHRELREDRTEQRVYHDTADLMLRDIQMSLAGLHEKLGDRLPELPPPNNNFVEADITPNLDFVGREEVLANLHGQLAAGNVAITHAVSGEGGIGKTQVAIRYAFDHGADYDGRWWLDASAAALTEQTEKLANTLGLDPPQGAKPEQIRAAVCKHLSQDTHLLILDNIERVEDLEGFALAEPSRVLITTRLKTLPPTRVLDFPLDVLERPDSIELLRKHREDLAGAVHETALGLVAEHLGDHALAVALAAAYLRKQENVDPAELLKRLKGADVGAKEHLFEKLEPGEHTAGYRLNVYASLTLHLPEFRDTPAMALLGLAAFCHPDAIPLDVFFGALREQRETVEDRLEALADVSIIRYGKTVTVHRLMQQAIRVEIGEPAQRAALTVLVGALASRFENPDDYGKWAAQDAYAAHAQAALAHAERLGEIPQAGLLGNQLGLYLHNRARFDDALAALRAAERFARAEYGDDHPNVAPCVGNIGSVLHDQGDLDGALACHREAERIERAAHGDQHPEVATAINNIATVLRDQGDLDEALKCFREAERIYRAAHGDKHPAVAVYVNNIGSVLLANGDLNGALACFREADQIDRAAYGDQHPNVATRDNNIGNVLQDQGDLDGALKCYREAERIDRAAYGDQHPAVATDVNNIGSVLCAKGDRDGARAMGSVAFRILLTTLGPRALNTMTTARNVSGLGIDALALAREIAGEQVAEELREALAECEQG